MTPAAPMPVLHCGSCGRRSFTLVDDRCEICREAAKILLDTVDDI